MFNDLMMIADEILAEDVDEATINARPDMIELGDEGML